MLLFSIRCAEFTAALLVRLEGLLPAAERRMPNACFDPLGVPRFAA